MKPKFYVFSDSHPCEAVLAAARYKGVAYDKVDLPPVMHAAYMRATFGRRTVPGLRIGERKVQGTSAIFHALDELEP
ncbi:MAG: glutathione S-transferase N-terminal domain-containing protein, partial [Solirubrobacteraceae bacterium]|nr:glutathione S-transferase N-terminal domain-containing protein [Solirubrobacteraceae bacterium]